METVVPEEKSFLIHDNWKNPFHVFISDEGILIQKSVFINEDENSECIWEDCLVIDSFEKLFIGYDESDVEKTLGNTILVQTKGLNYIWIGSNIIQFEAKSTIIDFHSPIGEDDNPYPWAVDKDYRVYLGYKDLILCNKQQIDAFNDYVISEIPYHKAIENNEFIIEGELKLIPHDHHKNIYMNDKIYHKCCQFPNIERRKMELQNFPLKRHPIWIKNEFPRENFNYNKII